MKNSFNTTVKSIIYILVCLTYLTLLSPTLIAVLACGLLALTIVSGFLRRHTSALNRQYLAEKAKL